MQRLEPADDVGRGEGRHVGAHGQHRVGSALPRLGERVVVVLVEAGAFVGDENQLARPSACVFEQLPHDVHVRCRRGGDDQLVFVAHRLAGTERRRFPRTRLRGFLGACGHGGCSARICVGGTRLQGGQRGAAYLHHVEQHAVVQRRGHLGGEHAVLERGQPRLHQSRHRRFAEQQQYVLASPHGLPPLPAATSRRARERWSRAAPCGSRSPCIPARRSGRGCQ